MPNLISVFVEDPDALLAAGMYDGGAIVRLQSSALEAGVYANEATAALVSGTQAYTLYDSDGTSATWYRTRYENAGGTLTSDWSPVFQVGGEEGGYLCSLYDVKQRLGITSSDASEDENLMEHIRAASDFLESRIGRWLSPRPASGTRTEIFDGSGASVLYIPYGIRSITTLGYATSDQPDTGGTYTALSAGTYSLVRPVTPGWPSTSIRLLSTAGISSFPAYANSISITGAFGWASVAPRVAQAAADLVVALHRGRADAGLGGSYTVNVDGSRTFERMPDSVFRLIAEWADRPVA